VIWHLVMEFILADISTICFGVLMNIPKRAYIPGGIIGGLVWILYVIMYYQLHFGLAMSNLLAAIMISILSLMAARKFRLPMIIFNVPALVSFVPGGQSYQVVRNFVLGNYGTAVSYLYQVIVIAGAITLGFGLGDVINAALHYRPKKWKNR
jgi:uncharacterized membrane protein YjjB (DUF3815 family)